MQHGLTNRLRGPIALVVFLVTLIAAVHPTTLIHIGPVLLFAMGELGALLVLWARAPHRRSDSPTPRGPA